MAVETNKAIVRRLFEEVYTRRNVAATDEFIAPGFVNHSAPFPVRSPDGPSEPPRLSLTLSLTATRPSRISSQKVTRSLSGQQTTSPINVMGSRWR